MKLKKFFLPFAAVTLALGLAACGNGDKEETEQDPTEQVDQEAIDKMNKKLAEQEVEDDLVVAVVNEEELNGMDYNVVLQNIQRQYQEMGIDPTAEELVEEIKERTLNELVSQTLFLQKAKSEDIEVSPEEIDNEYNLLITQFGNEEALEEVLEQEKVSKEDFKERIADSIVYSKYQEQIAPAEEVSDEEVQSYYDEFAEQSEGVEELPPLEDLSDNIRQLITEQKQQEKLLAHLDELKESADVELKI